ncbi:tripartite tricarboxylate transporter substrate binding protein [Elioraea sp. Yellowstone]|jgi:tripartite-type tricarboxylate transporter receptor subunit TctC|uniref:Bug family tripartite tricarboxylate transporter substrate binding protein n=1 Tax=Elioraea sp. Yellowstone TaxID=2592070 RepID=UPI0011533CB0|nr:tripartite tricarboxylate transporter substrate binding protein [Elioraea sp. Yellowstone]TQF84508.1 tripartite tricarboxylate transporter substrate binding protein [Elioraea sp. Yellowstone]
MRLPRRALLGASLAMPLAARAQARYPDRPVVLVAPFAPGGASDVAARTLAGHADKHLGQPIVVENRTGASGMVGTLHVRRAAPDGHTLLMARIASSAIVPAIDRAAPYAWDEFTFLGLVDINPYVVVVRADAPWRTLGELIEEIRRRPGALNHGSSGPSTILNLGIRYLLLQAGLAPDATVEIPFRGGGEVATALVGGQVQIVGQNLSEIAGALQGGQARALVVTTPERFAAIPDVPTAREAGFPALEAIVGWNALAGPPGLPDPVVRRWEAVLAALAKDEGWITATRRVGSVPQIRDGGAAKAFIGAQVALYRELGRRLGLSG